MISTESTPAIRPCAVDHRARSGSRPGAGRRARRASRPRGRASGRARCRASPAPSRAARSALREPAERPPLGVDDERVRDLGAVELRPHLARSPGRRGRAAPPRGRCRRPACSARRLSARSAPTKSSTKPSAGAISSSAGVAYWASLPPSLQHRDPVAHLDRLVDVVGDEEDRLADLGLQAQELVLQPLAVDRVDGAEGLVHQHHPGVGRERPATPTRCCWPPESWRGIAVAELGVEPDQLEQLGRAGAGALARPSRAGPAPWRCSGRSCGAGRGRSAGSRSRSRAAARRASARAPSGRRSGCRPR